MLLCHAERSEASTTHGPPLCQRWNPRSPRTHCLPRSGPLWNRQGCPARCTSLAILAPTGRRNVARGEVRRRRTGPLVVSSPQTPPRTGLAHSRAGSCVAPCGACPIHSSAYPQLRSGRQREPLRALHGYRAVDDWCGSVRLSGLCCGGYLAEGPRLENVIQVRLRLEVRYLGNPITWEAVSWAGAGHCTVAQLGKGAY